MSDNEKEKQVSNIMKYIEKNKLESIFTDIVKKKFKDVKSSIGAIDIGYGNTKYVSGCSDDGDILVGSFPSLTPLASQKISGNLFMSRDTRVVDVNGTLYEIGVDTEDLVSGTNSDVTKVLDETYIMSEAYKALFYGALSYMGKEHYDYLVMGLPVSFMHNDHKIVEMFKGQHKITDDFSCTVDNIIVVPQPLGGFYEVAIQKGIYEDMLDSYNLVIDPGYLTFDILVTKGLSPIETRSGAINGGMSKILNSLAKSISQSTGKSFDDLAAIDKAIRKPRLIKDKETGKESRKRVVKIGTTFIELDEHIKKTSSVIDSSITAMNNIVRTYDDIDNIILVGGAENIFAKKIEKNLEDRQIHKSEQSLYSNVTGFFLIGILQSLVK